MKQNNFIFLALPIYSGNKQETEKRKVKFLVSRIYSLNSQKEDSYYDSESRFYFTMIGYLSNFEKLKKDYNIKTDSDLQLICNLWKNLGEKIFTLLQGVYMLIIYNDKTGKLLIFQDEYGFNQPLYYIIYNNTFYFSNNLKYLLSTSKIERTLNVESVRQFLLTGFIYFGNVVPGEETLFNNIKKILPSQMIYRDKHTSIPSIILKKDVNNEVSSWY